MGKNSNRSIVLLPSLIVFAFAVFLATKLTSNLGQPAAPASTPVATVRITKSGFIPATLSVRRGTVVVWTNTDSSLHQVASNPYPKDTILRSLKSEILNNAQTYTYTANTPGTFGYHDQLTPTTNGTLVVSKR